MHCTVPATQALQIHLLLGVDLWQDNAHMQGIE